jgi:replication factor C large subunit
MHLESQSFAEKYRPKTFNEIVGQQTAITEIKDFISQFPKKKGIILHGPAGTGKTSLVHTLAKEYNLDIFELNSSDLRNRAKLEEILKPASLQSSLFKKGKILLMDEIDGVTGSDIGGVQELIRILEKSAHPIIMTGNDIWQSKFSPLRPKCKLIELRSLTIDTVTQVLQQITEKENKPQNPHFLKQIALKTQGDLRAAINDLQTYMAENTLLINFEEKRDREDNIFNILKILFQERGDCRNLFDKTKMSLDEILLWIEENIPREYKDLALAKAFLALSNADKFRGRIYRQQFWRFLVYQNLFQSAGISFAKHNLQTETKFTKYERPKRILKIWLNNQRTAKKKTIAKKYAKFVHCSTKRTMRDFQIIKTILIANPQLQTNLKLTSEEIAFLQK